MKLSTSQLHKIGPLAELLGRLLGPLLETGLPLMKKFFKPLTKSILIPLGLTAVVSATDISIYDKMFRSGTTTLIILNEEMKGLMKIVKH